MPPAADATTRFSNRVDDYVRHRPGYPNELVQTLQFEAGLKPDAVIADVGSGTGISSDLFLQLGCTVHGVEPNAALRAAAEARFAGQPRFHSRDATAEATSLPDASVDMVVAGQAFHWFDIPRTRAEFSRILRPQGFAALFWNSRRTDTTPFLKAYEALLNEFATDYRQVNHTNIDAAVLSTFFEGSSFRIPVVSKPPRIRLRRPTGPAAVVVLRPGRGPPAPRTDVAGIAAAVRRTSIRRARPVRLRHGTVLRPPALMRLSNGYHTTFNPTAECGSSSHRRKHPMLDPNRREFLQSAGLLAASSALLSPAHAFAANDTIHVACIGVGGRCRKLMETLRNIPGIKITTICDIWDHPLNLAKPLADAQATVSKDWQKVLDDKSIDAVVIGAPDHWHAPLTLAACAAGKDVYVEKPLTHDLSEGAALLEASTKHQRIVQVGTQQRSMPHIIKVRELVQSGHIGKVVRVHMSWNRNQDRFKRNIPALDFKSVEWKKFLGNAKDQPFDEYRMLNWRWFWDFGGGIFTDLMVHWIDVAHYVLNVDHPETAVSIGQHINSEGVWETPDAVQTLLTYPGNIQMHFEGMFSNARNGARIEFQGTDASIHVDRGAYQVIPERKSKVPASELILSTEPTFRGADFYDKPDGELVHLTNWVDCLRSRQQPTAPIEAGVSAASAAHLANVAMRNGGAALWSDQLRPAGRKI